MADLVVELAAPPLEVLAEAKERVTVRSETTEPLRGSGNCFAGAAIVGINGSTFSTRARQEPGFPRPVARFGSSPVWRRDQLEEYARSFYGHLMPGNEEEAAGLLDAYLEQANTKARLAKVETGEPT